MSNLSSKQMVTIQNRHAVINQKGVWWIGWIEDMPGVNCQESTREDLVQSLRATLQEAIEMNHAEAIEVARIL